MRFCPFCAQENTDEASECAHCGRGLPTLGPRTMSVPALPKQPALRPPPVRPLPRARGVPTPALSHPSGPTGTAGVARAPEAPLRTVLGMAAHAAADPLENATRVDASPFDGPTMQTPRLEPEEHTSPTPRFDEMSHVSTAVRVGGSPSGVADDDTPDEVTSNSDDPPTAVDPVSRPSGKTKLPSTGVSSPLRVGPRSTTPPWGAPQSPDASAASSSLPSSSRPPPAPLPPPPGNALAPLRSDPPETHTNPSTQLPSVSGKIDLTFDGETMPAATLGLPPMPTPPDAGLLPAVRYLPPLARAVWARIQAQNALKEKLHADQRLLDDALHDLGRAAWESPERPAELSDELGRADEDEHRRKESEKEVARLDMSVAAERERFSDDEHKRKEDIASREATVGRLTGDLAERRRAQRIEDKVFQTVVSRLAGVEKKRDGLVAKAARAEVTPPEKGGGAHTAANLRKEAEDLQREVDGMRPERDEAEARVRALDEPIADLERQLGDAREGLSQAQAELAAERKANAEQLETLKTDRARNEEVRTTAEKAIRLRLTSTGTLLNLHRLEGPKHRERLGSIYARIDQLTGTAAAREARIAELETERRGFDRPAVQRGLIVLVGAVGVAIFLLVILIVLAAR